MVFSAGIGVAGAHIMVDDVVIRATAGGMTATGGYATIRNHGDTDDRLVGVQADFAGKAEIHTMENVDGVMKMRPLANGVLVPASGMLTLAPGGKHLMFMALDGVMEPGSMKSVTLVFEKAGEIAVMAHVKKPGDIAKAGHDDHSGHDMGKKKQHDH